MTAITIRQAVLVDLDALLTLFDGYRQFDGQPTWPVQSSFTPEVSQSNASGHVAG